LTQSQYSDANVDVATTYSYIVTAHGDMGPGFAISDPLEITTPTECKIILPVSEIKVTDFDNNGLNIGASGYPETFNKQPTFSGTTNMSNAKITTLISLTTLIISAEITANSTGYWTWQPPVEISSGQHALVLTAMDPNDDTRTVSESFTFLIKNKKSGGGNEEHNKKEENTTITTPVGTVPIAIPLAFALILEKDSVLPGQELTTTVEINKLLSNFDGRSATVRYTIIDPAGNNVGSFTENTTLHLGSKIGKNISMAKYLTNGQYRLRAEIIFGSYNFSQEKNFTIEPLPILNFGGRVTATCPQLLSQLGTISLWLLICLILWLFLFWREYWKQLQALRHITEKNLIGMGFFGGKKGKGVSR
jgi:hypothetical protein